MGEVLTHGVTATQVLEASHVDGATITATSQRLNLEQVEGLIVRAAARFNTILTSRDFILGDLDEHPDAHEKLKAGIIAAAAYEVDRRFGMSGESTERLRREAEALEAELEHAHLREMGDAEPPCARRTRRVIGRGLS
jgi:hypothetical protein